MVGRARLVSELALTHISMSQTIQTHNWDALRFFYLNKLVMAEAGGHDVQISWFSGYGAEFTLERANRDDIQITQVIDFKLTNIEAFKRHLVDKKIHFECVANNEIRASDPDGNILRMKSQTT
jgi:hypothetical protein